MKYLQIQGEIIIVFIILRLNQKWKQMVPLKKKKKKKCWPENYHSDGFWFDADIQKITDRTPHPIKSVHVLCTRRKRIKLFTVFHNGVTGVTITSLLCGGLSYWHFWFIYWLTFLIIRQTNKISVRIMKTAPIHYQKDNLSKKTGHWIYEWHFWRYFWHVCPNCELIFRLNKDIIMG